MLAALSKRLSKRANGMPRRGRFVNHPQHNRVRTKLGLSDQSGPEVSAVSLEQNQIILPGKKHRIVRCLAHSGHTIVRPNLLGSPNNGIVGNFNPLILNTDLIMTVTRLPLGIFDHISVSERAT
jgi:hypothetical protein